MGRQVAEWDKFWQESSAEASFIGATGTHSVFTQYWMEFFSALEPISGKSLCIDIASGSGIVIQCAQTQFGDRMPLYSGLDISAAAINRLATRFPNVTGIVADAASIPLDSYSFELVTSNFGVEYAGLEGILEAARIVGVGGHLALVLHCRPGTIYDECSTSLQVIDRLRQVRLFPLARAMFKAGFAASRGAEYRSYERATRKFRPAYRLLEQSMLKHGEGVASGLVFRLRNDIEQINQGLQDYDSGDVLVWLDRLSDELLSYRSRMKSMTNVAITRKTLEQIGQGLSESGFSITDITPLYDQADIKTQLAWSLQARRDSVSS